jgi:hypothetical protein
MEQESRAQGWIEWHLAATSAQLHLAPLRTTLPSVSICVLYNPEKWGNNLEQVLTSVRAQRNYATMPWEVVVYVKGNENALPVEEDVSRLARAVEPLPVRIVRHKEDESDIVILYGFAVTQTRTEYAVLLDPVSWFYGDNAIGQLVEVATRTRAQIVTAQAVLNDTTNSMLLHIGSVGMYSSIVNCIGDWSIFIIFRYSEFLTKKLLLTPLSSSLPLSLSRPLFLFLSILYCSTLFLSCIVIP